MRSSGGPRLDVSYGGLASVAATLTSTAGNLAALAAAPPAHAPLAPDEVSTSAAARLTEHGGVLASRAADGAAVLAAAAAAVAGVSTFMAETDLANAASLAVGAGAPAAVGGPVTPAAVKTNAVAFDTPIAPMAPRPGEATAALIEAGSSSAGTTFHTACCAYENAFQACAVAARNAENAVAEGITGKTGPQLSAALGKFAAWADSMATHSASVAKAAQDHGGRFDQTQQQTPRTQQFANTRDSLTRAQMLMVQTGGMVGAEHVVRFGNHLQQLDTKATTSGMSYHLGELPQAPPPPPPVTDIVNDGANSPSEGAGQPEDRATAPDEDQQDAGAGVPSELDATADTAGADPLTDPLADPGADPLLAADAETSPLGGDPMQQMMPMAAMIPSALAGALGGAMGAVTSVPQQVGQQVMGAAQQLMQGAAESMAEPDLGFDDALDGGGLSDFGGGLGSGGGGGGGMEPAGLDTSLPPGGGALAAASGPTGGPALPTVSGAVGPAAPSAPAGAGMGGMGMMPPMMGGMGGGAGAGAGGGRATPPADKKVVLASIPNGEPVTGEVERRQTATVADPVAPKAPDGEQPASGRPRRRRVVMPEDNQGDPK